MASTTNSSPSEARAVRLVARPERHLIRPAASRRHILFTVTTSAVESAPVRPPLRLGLVLDRSGSMAGDRLALAKRATLALLDRLTAADEVAVVVFDDQIDVVQPRAAVSPALRARVKSALRGIEARASTALHQGWLTGCHQIAADTLGLDGARLAHCFLLTDGQANVGLTDPEIVAGQAAAIRRNAAVGTSTFGVGMDYNEALLGPMAVGGGGQFHHLAGPAAIALTFDNALTALATAVAVNVRLEVHADSSVDLDVISAYHLDAEAPGAWSIGLGDLAARDERPVVVRATLPARGDAGDQSVRARLVWQVDGREWQSAWETVRFTYASHAACDAEVRDAAVMHWVGLHHAARAEREAVRLLNENRDADATTLLAHVSARIASYAGDDESLQGAVQSLAAPPAPAERKERYFQSQTRSRGQKDLRAPQP
ncbi:MAG: VWA domain-containing protein [Chloroflexi bacterium]|nr:VWA domain-containing protein [Chloroflexota bacterium]